MFVTYITQLISLYCILLSENSGEREWSKIMCKTNCLFKSRQRCLYMCVTNYDEIVLACLLFRLQPLFAKPSSSVHMHRKVIGACHITIEYTEQIMKSISAWCMGSWGGRSRVILVRKRNRISPVIQVIKGHKWCLQIREVVLVLLVNSGRSEVSSKLWKSLSKVRISEIRSKQNKIEGSTRDPTP